MAFYACRELYFLKELSQLLLIKRIIPEERLLLKKSDVLTLRTGISGLTEGGRGCVCRFLSPALRLRPLRSVTRGSQRAQEDRTGVVLARPASPQGTEDGGSRRGWAAIHFPRPRQIPKSLYPFPGAL